MYNILFSEQWILDRCFEGQRTFFWVVLLISIFVGVSTFIAFKEGVKKIFFRIILSLITFVSAFILVFIFIMLLAHVVIGCSMGAFWTPIRAAGTYTHILKDYKAKNGYYPKSEEEMSKLAPDLYQKVKDTSEDIYIYDTKTNSYKWIIRTSFYYITVVDPNNYYVIYKVPHFFTIAPRSNPIYPSDYPKVLGIK